MHADREAGFELGSMPCRRGDKYHDEERQKQKTNESVRASEHMNASGRASACESGKRACSHMSSFTNSDRVRKQELAIVLGTSSSSSSSSADSPTDLAVPLSSSYRVLEHGREYMIKKNPTRASCMHMYGANVCNAMQCMHACIHVCVCRWWCAGRP